MCLTLSYLLGCCLLVDVAYVRIAIRVDEHGDVLVSGTTQSTMLPITPNALSSQPGSNFVFKLSDNGTDLEYSTYFDFGVTTTVYAVGYSPDGHFVCGGIMLASFDGTLPTTPDAYQAEFKGTVE